MKKQLEMLTLVLFFLLQISVVFASTANSHYALIMDAGSTGSRLHLFEYTTDSKIPVIHELFSESVKPGLSSYENHPEAAGASLKKPVEDALAELKKKQIDPSTVSISILATAGMRLLPADKQAAIYDNVSFYLKNNYPLVLGEIKTIPGKMEGLFGWLDVNYLAKSFESETDTTKGSIDLGGASTQITFSTQDLSKQEDEFKLHLGNQDYLVYSKSFLGLGLVEALNQVNQQPLAAACYPAHYPMSSGQSGSFDFASCGNLYRNLMIQHAVQQELPFLGDQAFIAYSGAYFTANFFGVDKTPSQKALDTQVQAVCNQSWEQILAAYPHEPETHLSMYCANGIYLSQLLFTVYGLQEKQLTISNQVNQQNVDWSLGALLYQLVSSGNQ